MHRITSRFAAVATLALIAAPAAHAASVPPTPMQKDVQQLIQHVRQDTNQTAGHTQAYALRIARPLQSALRAEVIRTTGATKSQVNKTTSFALTTLTKTNALVKGQLNKTTATALKTVGSTTQTTKATTRYAASTLAAAYRTVGITTFAIVDGTGRLVAGSSGISVFTPVAGSWDMRWRTSLDGCVVVALNNSLTGPIMRTGRVSSTEIRVKDKGAAAQAGDSGFSVAVIC
jgi:hypothetical protein